MARTIVQIYNCYHTKIWTQSSVNRWNVRPYTHFFGFRPTQALSKLMQEVKRDSSEWINNQNLTMGKFSWQEGYGAFSYGKSQISNVINYIETQEKHHKKRTFREEFLEFLKSFDVEYDERYIFKDINE